MQVRVDKFMETARKELKNELSQAFLLLVGLGAPMLRQIGMSSFPDPECAVNYSRAIRSEVIERIPELLEEFEKNATAKGAKVLWARDAKEANDIVLNIAKERNIDYVTKGKSMITEEIGLNEHLIKNGVNALETDLGEVITQTLDIPPFHLVGPAINIPPEKISEGFLKRGILKEATTDPVSLGKAARVFLRDKFRKLDMGIVGVNMAIANTGTFLNEENEGNIRMNKSSPKTLVAIMSIEKVVPNMADAIHISRMLSRYCTGQKFPSYVSLDTGPKRADELDGPEEVFIVILDNGRSEIYQNELNSQVLRCIRCGACLATCPVYTKIGGYPYGFAYSGPIGTVLNPLFLGIRETKDLYRACTLCGSCKTTCPAGLDHPSLILSYRQKEIELKNQDSKGLMPKFEKAFAELVSFGMRFSLLWSLGIKLVRPMMNAFAKDGYISSMPYGAKGWLQCRDLKVMPPKTFHERWVDLSRDPASFADTSKKEGM